MARDRRERELRRQEKARNKKPLGERIGSHFSSQARSIGELGDVIVNRPSTLPSEAHGWFRRWFAKVWKVRGGGLYAFGFAVTFTIYEIRMVLEDLSNGWNVGALFSGEIVSFIVDFFVDTLVNTVHAFMWPAYAVQIAPPFGVIALVLAFILFPKFLKKPMEQWLFADENDPGLPAADPDESEKTP